MSHPSLTHGQDPIFFSLAHPPSSRHSHIQHLSLSFSPHLMFLIYSSPPLDFSFVAPWQVLSLLVPQSPSILFSSLNHLSDYLVQFKTRPLHLFEPVSSTLAFCHRSLVVLFHGRGSVHQRSWEHSRLFPLFFSLPSCSVYTHTETTIAIKFFSTPNRQRMMCKGGAEADVIAIASMDDR